MAAGSSTSAELPAPAAAAALPHIAIFPFLSKGHTIPLLHLARLLHRRRLATFTILTTPLNAPFVRASLDDLPPEAGAILELPFPTDAPGVPPGVESTDQLPSISDFLAFVGATSRLRPHFERALAGLHPAAAFLVSDGFHGWTAESARALGIPRLVFYGMGWYAFTVSTVVTIGRQHAGLASEVEPFQVPSFPRIPLTKADLPPALGDPDASGPEKNFILEQAKATAESRGIIVNSFHEMETGFADHWNQHFHPKAWSVGPLCLVMWPESRSLPAKYAEWLDARSAEGRPVLYISFGTQAEVSPQQLEELAAALENSGVDFFWVVRPKDGAAPALAAGAGFEERVAGRGLVAREWMPQAEALSHAAVRGFLSHCGWNSVQESICAGVPILAWPMMADQHLNAKLVVEELGVGLRVGPADGRLVGRDCIEVLATDLLVGEKGREAAAKVAELRIAARRAMERGGSSWCSLEGMVKEVCGEEEPRRPAEPTDRAPATAIG